ncbi:prolyl oligopeptidase family serine peptidase [Arenibacter sp. ARW7G5Y1]|uniref:carboxylesterase family protein n=1 Tax=Arenibacter sp. ARW7G5Y1 TaxID=2135619 RepID=UPI000D91C6E8|nr:prolyl oligopeptidase family serine peptidase [Arenibacter sp. ARW7G5Y1]PXX28260.1 prolyl oligopeptidase family protein [Arenibacter sp. ARW7G5Y1]
MAKFYKKSAIVFVMLLVLPFFLIGQQRTGNIVEYFGKEKVEEIHEGKVVHIFSKALALTIPSFGFESSTFPVDPVFDQFLMNPGKKVSDGEVFDIDYSGNEIKWTAIKVDSTNSFSGRGLRSGYVYLTYNSGSEKTVLFEASGHSLASINGYPYEGDHYDFGWNLIPMRLKKGINSIVLKVGRFPRIRARILEPKAEVQFTTRDVTVPDLLLEEDMEYKAAIRIINASDKWVRKHAIVAKVNGKELKSQVMDIPPFTVYKVPFSIPSSPLDTNLEKVNVDLQLLHGNGQQVSAETLTLNVKSKYKHHKRTFISDIDKSVQYYSVAPNKSGYKEGTALFLSVHGASVEAVNQANAYKQKDWGNLVAPTNRRPFGFAWEDWGRLDALEVLAESKRLFKPDHSKIYLTGHSMGGHGTWYLGATYPDHFAAIAPCAGYPDLLLYRGGRSERIAELTEEQRNRYGITPKMFERMTAEYVPNAVENIVERAGTPSRTLKLIRNYLHHGVYVLHGEKDNVVPTSIARDMRERLGQFHPDFTYYEYPGGTHWYGDHSVDWEPIFNLFKQRTIPQAKDIKKLEFSTGSPGVSASSHFIAIHHQQIPFEVSSFDFSWDTVLKVDTKNVSLLEIDFTQLPGDINNIEINGLAVKIPVKKSTFFKELDGEWKIVDKPTLKEKGPHRYGGFKDAFRNDVVFVYATKGSQAENDWYYNKARFDADTFWYKANGNIELVADTDFSLKDYPNRNVVVYGNKNNNDAWDKLLKDSPVQVFNNKLNFGSRSISGNNWGLYFIVPRADSDVASVGVVTATGILGMKAAYANHYLVNGTTFPDLLLFDETVLTQGTSAVKCAGFFGNDWTIEKGDFEWK